VPEVPVNVPPAFQLRGRKLDPTVVVSTAFGVELGKPTYVELTFACGHKLVRLRPWYEKHKGKAMRCPRCP
jgi:hypothetical protein